MSETGLVYTFTTPKLQPLVTKPEGKNLIQVNELATVVEVYTWLMVVLQACLNAPEPPSENPNGDVPDDQTAEDPHGAPPGVAPPAGMRSNGAIPSYPGLTAEQQQIVYQQYMQQQQHGGIGQYPMPQQVCFFITSGFRFTAHCFLVILLLPAIHLQLAITPNATQKMEPVAF